MDVVNLYVRLFTKGVFFNHRTPCQRYLTTSATGATTVDLQDVKCAKILPKKCFSAARHKCEIGVAQSYMEGILLLKDIPIPIGHAVFRTADGQIHDISREAEHGDQYVRFVEIAAAEFVASMSDPRFVEEFEKHTEYPYSRARMASSRWK